MSRELNASGYELSDPSLCCNTQHSPASWPCSAERHMHNAGSMRHHHDLGSFQMSSVPCVGRSSTSGRVLKRQRVEGGLLLQAARGLAEAVAHVGDGVQLLQELHLAREQRPLQDALQVGCMRLHYLQQGPQVSPCCQSLVFRTSAALPEACNSCVRQASMTLVWSILHQEHVMTEHIQRVIWLWVTANLISCMRLCAIGR